MKTMKKLLLVAIIGAALVYLGAPTVASAVPITYDVSGTATVIVGQDNFGVGGVLSGTFTYDPAQPVGVGTLELQISPWFFKPSERMSLPGFIQLIQTQSR